MSCFDNQNVPNVQIRINGVPILDNQELHFDEKQNCIRKAPLSHESFSDSKSLLRWVHKNRHKQNSEEQKKYASTQSLIEERSLRSVELVDMIDRLVIGKDLVYSGPFGPRPVIYLDYTASGKPLRCIEDFITDKVLPYYANTHTVSSYTSVQTTKFRDEAREFLKAATSAGDDDVVIFHSAGTTGCVHKLIHHALYKDLTSSKKPKRTVVFTSPFEHHSNVLPWSEAKAEIVNVPVNKYGQIDIKYLKQKLKDYQHKNVDLIGAFSAASNVTGIVSDDVALTILMHKYGGLAFFDYAAGAPHLKVNMNPKLEDPSLEKLAQKDAIYFSGHKFIGGPQTTGVLVAKRFVFKNPVPHGQGGGTVSMVTSEKHSYLEDIVEREEGGTPSIIENIRFGLVMKLKMEVGPENIVAREVLFTKRAFDVWSKIPNLVILGGTNNPRLPIISFLIEHTQTGYYLHHNFVASILNDLFGIQARGGCMCAGPYAQILLNVSEKLAVQYENIFSVPSQRKSHEKSCDGDDMIFKPGFTRISLPYHASPEEIDYTIKAIAFLAERGWELLPLYRADFKTGSYTTTHHTTMHRARSLNCCNFGPNGLEFDDFKEPTEPPCPSFQECLDYATGILPKLQGRSYIPEKAKTLSPNLEKFRWFLLAGEALEILKNPLKHSIKSSRLFEVKKHQFENQSLEKIKKEAFPGSAVDQILNSVWGDKTHPLTFSIMENEAILRDRKRNISNSSLCLSSRHTSLDAEDDGGYSTGNSSPKSRTSRNLDLFGVPTFQ